MTYFIVTPRVAEAKGYGFGRTSGTLNAVTSMLDGVITSAKSDPSSPLPNLGGAELALKGAQVESIKRSTKGTILPYISGLLASIKEYQQFIDAHKDQEARLVLTAGLNSSNQALKQILAKTNEQVNDQIESAPKIASISKLVLSITVLIGILAFVQSLSSFGFGNEKKWKLEALDHSIGRPALTALGQFIAKRAEREDDQPTRAAAANLIYGSIVSPALDNFVSASSITFEFDRHDLAREIEFASSYLFFINEGKSSESDFPHGVCEIVCRRGVIGLSLIHWMDNLRHDLKVKEFAMTHDQHDEKWRVIIETVGGEIHPDAYQNISSKMALKAGIDKDHAESIDLVRATLRRLADSFTVTHENGNIRLSVWFPGQPKT